MSEPIAYFIFDVESVADGPLIESARYGGEDIGAEEAILRYQNERLEQTGSTFIPHTFMLPIAVVIAKVTADFRLIDIVSLDEPEFRPHVITKHFWQGWEAYQMPTWVTFNGRSFDIPLMELSAFRCGLSVPKWFQDTGYKSPRSRFGGNAHLDLQELLTNYGAARFNGGLNVAAQMLGKPGKMGLSGDQVQSYFDKGDLQAISDYCRCDVLDTYFVFLRCMVLIGKINLEQETELIAHAKQWIERKSDSCGACSAYLEKWKDWVNPWDQPMPTDDKRPTDDKPPTADKPPTDVKTLPANAEDAAD